MPTFPSPAQTFDPAVLMSLLSGFAGRKVLCIGDVMVDRSIYGDVKRISPEAPVPVVRITRETSALGGAGNVVRNLAALGAAPSFVSVVGDDRAGREVGQLLGALSGVEPYLRVSRTRETTIKNRFFSADGHHLLRADRETITPLTPVDADDLKRAAIAQIADADAVIVSDYAKGLLAGDLAAAVIVAARAAKKPVIVDPKGSDYARYAGASVITPNRAEMEQVIGKWSVEADLRTKAHNLREQLNLEGMLLTRSEEGMTLFDANGELHVSAQAREVFDVTGAGDTVIATMATLVGAGLSLREAMPLANRAGGIVVGKFGTATVSYEELFA